jgi:hypothetical protein
MRRVTRFQRSTAPSKAWMPNARRQCCCQAPQPRSGAPQAQGLMAALWPEHNRHAVDRGPQPHRLQTRFHWRRCIDDDLYQP